MCSVYFVVAEAAHNTEILSGNLCLVKLMSGKNSALTAQDETAGEFSVELVVPSATSCIAAGLMDVFHVRKVRLFDHFRVGRILETIDIVNIACCMELRHEQGITVPELCFYERSVEFLESQRTELVFYRFKKLNVRICTSGNDACRLNTDVVCAECAVFPVA